MAHALNARRLLAHVAGKATIQPPPGGWTQEEFRKRGRLLVMTLYRTSQIIIRRQAAALARDVRDLLIGQVAAVAQRGVDRRLRQAGYTWARIQHTKASAVGFVLLATVEFWEGIVDEVLREEAGQVGARVKRSVQSTMGQGAAKTQLLLGEEVDLSRTIAEQAEEVGARITRIDDTTRMRLNQTIRDSISRGETVQETAQRIQRAGAGMGQTRSLLIARTETVNAWNKGSALSFQRSSSVTHVSVIGCQAREPDSPKYRGESTCNIQDVPVADAATLEFHINHTGTMVPSRFMEADDRGQAPGGFELPS